MPTTTSTISLPRPDGSTLVYTMHEPLERPRHPQTFTSRLVYAAPHVVPDVRAAYTPGRGPAVDWDTTLAFRRHLYSYGLGIAEAMDTTERGPDGLDWPRAQELIRLSLELARETGGLIACGVGTDQLEEQAPSLRQVTDAFLEQLAFVEDLGGAGILRASHALHRAASSEADYLQVYGEVLTKAQRPLILHWLGTAFDPSLTRYWGHEDQRVSMDAVVRLAEEHEDDLVGIKFSLLDQALEREFRERLPETVKVFTGDDYDYATMLRDEGGRHSHGLLGVFDPIAPIASTAFAALDAGDEPAFVQQMESTLPLARTMFEAPAARYKVGVVFTAWIAGHQEHARMVTGNEGMHSVLHLVDLFMMMDELRLLPDPQLAVHRMGLVLAANGVA
ncbi:DUF993 family protein [Compostimonas suwonensis]|uniref:Uncharacterized protein DUF993 n=1 Tax=Compostimonas suwonensis TaxID=1048394 RepID=A0A2M9C0A6_9MICO|nr:DUF993 family protein [Compostimonas suwonensis]PJJ63766.1 uncharacterized protein DUF993 [Compostimonas suwonensis]